MPNPVLLCENVLIAQGSIHINQQTSNGIPTNIWEVNVTNPAGQNGNSKPLWILDGQHRINGLAASSQKNMPIPVVFLLNHSYQAYSGPLVAKVFAQVTTAAKPLDELHNEWLTYAFGLDQYSPSRPTSAANSSAMETIAELCKTPQFSAGALQNPFYNKVQFNIFNGGVTCGPVAGGFRYTCLAIKELVRTHYYACSSSFGHHLSPYDLAEQMALAYDVLCSKVSAPHDKTVFFGRANYEHSIMQDAYWVGIFAYILQKGPFQRNSLEALLTVLQFPSTSWDFSSWVKSMNGRIAGTSRQLALSTFSKAFASGVLPTSSGNLVDYLKGNDAEIELEFAPLTSAGRVSRSGKSLLKLRNGNRLSPSISPAKHFRVKSKSGNIGRMELIDANHPPGRPIIYSEKGVTITPTEHKNPLSLVITMHHYGGVESTAFVDLTW